MMDQDDDCAAALALEVIRGKWKALILYHLAQTEMMRFNNLHRHIPDITRHTLTRQLRELEGDGIVARKVYPEIPPRVEYSLTQYGVTLLPILEAMHSWGQLHQQNDSSSTV